MSLHSYGVISAYYRQCVIYSCGCIVDDVDAFLLNIKFNTEDVSWVWKWYEAERNIREAFRQ